MGVKVTVKDVVLRNIAAASCSAGQAAVQAGVVGQYVCPNFLKILSVFNYETRPHLYKILCPSVSPWIRQSVGQAFLNYRGVS